MHWFNSVVPWLLRRMRLEQEIATDARVPEVTGASERSADGETLLRLPAGGVGRGATLGVPGPGTADAQADLEERFRAIAAFRPAGARSRTVVPLMSVLAVVCWTNAAVPPAPREESTPMNAGGVTALLPRGEELGAGWSNRVTSLVDRRGPTEEHFDPGVFGPAREAIRSHVPEGGAFCDMSYFRDGAFVFEAWLRRAESTNHVEELWDRLRHAPLVPRLADGKVGKRSIRRVGDREAILYENDSRTLWMASGLWVLNLNVYGHGQPVANDELFSIAEVFARRLLGQPVAARTDRAEDVAAGEDR